MTRNPDRRRLRCAKNCPGWPSEYCWTWGGPVVTCRCGARRYRSVSVPKTLWRRLTRHAKGTRLVERLQHVWRLLGWFDRVTILLLALLLLGGPIFVLVRYLLVWRYAS